MATVKKKVENKVAVSDKVKAKVTTAPKSAPAKSKKSSDDPLEDAVNEVMEVIDEHEMASSSVSRSETLDFYKSIVQQCQDRMETIRSEMEGDDDDIIDEDDGDPD